MHAFICCRLRIELIGVDKPMQSTYTSFVQRYTIEDCFSDERIFFFFRGFWGGGELATVKKAKYNLTGYVWWITLVEIKRESLSCLICDEWKTGRYKRDRGKNYLLLLRPCFLFPLWSSEILTVLNLWRPPQHHICSIWPKSNNYCWTLEVYASQFTWQVDRVLQLENSGNPDPESTCMVPTGK